jgi:hypothetical protein
MDDGFEIIGYDLMEPMTIAFVDDPIMHLAFKRWRSNHHTWSPAYRDVTITARALHIQTEFWTHLEVPE